jgi:hypothetical protein
MPVISTVSTGRAFRSIFAGDLRRISSQNPISTAPNVKTLLSVLLTLILLPQLAAAQDGFAALDLSWDYAHVREDVGELADFSVATNGDAKEVDIDFGDGSNRTVYVDPTVGWSLTHWIHPFTKPGTYNVTTSAWTSAHKLIGRDTLTTTIHFANLTNRLIGSDWHLFAAEPIGGQRHALTGSTLRFLTNGQYIYTGPTSGELQFLSGAYTKTAPADEYEITRDDHYPIERVTFHNLYEDTLFLAYNGSYYYFERAAMSVRLELAQHVRVSPNPAKESVTISLAGAQLEPTLSLTLFDASGKVVRREHYHSISDNLTLDVTDLTAGYYIGEITGQRMRYSFKVVRE